MSTSQLSPLVACCYKFVWIVLRCELFFSIQTNALTITTLLYSLIYFLVSRIHVRCFRIKILWIVAHLPHLRLISPIVWIWKELLSKNQKTKKVKFQQNTHHAYFVPNMWELISYTFIYRENFVFLTWYWMQVRYKCVQEMGILVRIYAYSKQWNIFPFAMLCSPRKLHTTMSQTEIILFSFKLL